ncbi:MAG: radical SAM protein [Candidatus Neomarinimicrobiota bacterium]
MKVTFIMPCVGRKTNQRYVRSWCMEPLAIATLKALTPDNIDCAFYDDRLESIPYNDPTDLIAINIETYTARRAYQIAAEYKKRAIPVVMGGFHATLMPDEVEQNADAVVIGEAENLWLQVINDAASGTLKSRYQSENQPMLGGVIPDRSIYASKKYINLTLIETARGCRFSCEFCSISQFYKSTYRARPIDEIIEEIKLTGSKRIFFTDDNIAVDKKRTIKFLNALIPLNINWVGQVSIDVAKDDNMISLLKRSGCAGVLIGFESLDTNNLIAMGKNINKIHLNFAEAINRLRTYGICVYGTFVFGYDEDTEGSFVETLRFAKQTKLFFAAFNHLVPFPGTPLYSRLKNEGRLRYKSWWLSGNYRFGELAFNPKKLTAQKVSILCFKYRRLFYHPLSIVKRGIDFKANCKNITMAVLFIHQNIATRLDVERRQQLPLGIKEVVYK